MFNIFCPYIKILNKLMRSTWCSLNKFDGSLAQKRVLIVHNMITICYLYLQFLDIFFVDQDPNFLPIRTQEKSTIQIRKKDPDTKHCYKCSTVNAVALTSRPPRWGRQSPPCWRRQSWRGWRACSPQTRRGSAAQHPAQYTVTHNQCCGLRSCHFFSTTPGSCF